MDAVGLGYAPSVRYTTRTAQFSSSMFRDRHTLDPQYHLPSISSDLWFTFQASWLSCWLQPFSRLPWYANSQNVNLFTKTNQYCTGKMPPRETGGSLPPNANSCGISHTSTVKTHNSMVWTREKLQYIPLSATGSVQFQVCSVFIGVCTYASRDKKKTRLKTLSTAVCTIASLSIKKLNLFARNTTVHLAPPFAQRTRRHLSS